MAIDHKKIGSDPRLSWDVWVKPNYNALLTGITVSAVTCISTPLSASQTTPSFAPVTVPPHVYDGGWEYFVGGGMAVFDCDQDHLPDVFIAGGEGQSALLRNQSLRGGDIRFAKQTPQELALENVTGAYPFDLDGDGFLDLAVLRVGANMIFKGAADCQFTPFMAFKDEYVSGWTTSFSATWETGQSLPTMVFGNYVDRNHPEGPFGTCDKNFLYRPNGTNYQNALALDPGYCPLSMLFTDWGRQGRADLRISNDRHYYLHDGEEQMWKMTDDPQLYTAEEGWQTHKLWGMGIASRDITGDGFPEVYLTSMGDQRLQLLDKDQDGPFYRDATYSRGTTAHRPYTGGDGRPSTGWHVDFGDAQNDGLDDIFVTKGNVQQMPGSAMDDPNNLMQQQLDGTFQEVGDSAGIASMHRSRGGSMVDFNLDGLLDIAVVNRQADFEVYQNITVETGNWVAIKLQQENTNRDAIGAWIELMVGSQKVSRELTVGGGHAGGKIGPEHFGLGSFETAKMRVIWPDQTHSNWVEVKAGSTILALRNGQEALTLKDY